jgi:hypothetical protein
VQAVKFIILGVLLFVLVRYLGVYRRTTEFNHYVEEEVSLVRAKGTLKEILLLKAAEKKLPITDENINITTTGALLRVSIEYQVPLDLILFQKELTFHSSGMRTD